MNDRIKEFGRQASELALDEYRTRQKTEFAGDVIYSDIYDQKFAELIIRECIEQGNTLANYYINTHSEQEQVMLLASIADYSNEIRKHFGIE